MVFFPNKKMEMLIDAVKAMVNNSFKENFYRKRKKKVINVLTVFFFFFSFFIKSGVKTFLKLIVNHFLKGTY